jgi:hypothetical protein
VRICQNVHSQLASQVPKHQPKTLSHYYAVTRIARSIAYRRHAHAQESRAISDLPLSFFKRKLWKAQNKTLPWFNCASHGRYCPCVALCVHLPIPHPNGRLKNGSSQQLLSCRAPVFQGRFPRRRRYWCRVNKTNALCCCGVFVRWNYTALCKIFSLLKNLINSKESSVGAGAACFLDKFYFCRVKGLPRESTIECDRWPTWWSMWGWWLVDDSLMTRKVIRVDMTCGWLFGNRSVKYVCAVISRNVISNYVIGIHVGDITHT